MSAGPKVTWIVHGTLVEVAALDAETGELGILAHGEATPSRVVVPIDVVRRCAALLLRAGSFKVTVEAIIPSREGEDRP